MTVRTNEKYKRELIKLKCFISNIKKKIPGITLETLYGLVFCRTVQRYSLFVNLCHTILYIYFIYHPNSHRKQFYLMVEDWPAWPPIYSPKAAVQLSGRSPQGNQRSKLISVNPLLVKIKL